MTDQTGHPDFQADDPLEDQSQDQPQDEPQQDEPVDTPPPKSFKDRFKGKSPEELLDILEEKERFIGQKTTELTDLKSRIESLESSQVTGGAQVEPDLGHDPFSFMPPTRSYQGYGGFDPNAVGPGIAPGAPAGGSDAQTFDYEKPVESTRNVVRQELASFQLNSMAREFNQNVTRAKSAFVIGSKSALGRNKRLFGGIEKEVQKRVYDFYYPFVMQGQPVDDILRTDEPWEKAAQNIRLERREFDKLMPEKIKPMAATRTEHPDSALPGPRESGKRFTDVDWGSDEVRAWMKAHKFTRKDAEEIIAQTQEAVESGELKV